MPPNRNNVPLPPPGNLQPSFTPQAPQFQQNQNGTYEVLPPLPSANNTGHSGHNPYEFIVNPNTPRRSPNILSGLISSWKGLVVVGVGVVVLLFVVGIVLTSLAPKGSTPGLTAAAQRQQEIVRIATAANENANSPDVRNFAITVAITVQSNQQQTIEYLASHGTKLSSKVLALDQSAQTDTLLANAVTIGSYDTAVTQNLTSQLQTYETTLKNTFKQTKSKSAKTLLQTNYQTAENLLAQSKSLQVSTN